MTSVRNSSSADRDIIECAEWLETQQAGLGSKFLDAVDEALVEISLRPNACPTYPLTGARLKAELRSLRLGRFPHRVFFEVTSDEVVIYAVVHPHRDLESLLRARLGVR